jgi:hypothetical protein
MYLKWIKVKYHQNKVFAMGDIKQGAEYADYYCSAP